MAEDKPIHFVVVNCESARFNGFYTLDRETDGGLRYVNAADDKVVCEGNDLRWCLSDPRSLLTCDGPLSGSAWVYREDDEREVLNSSREREVLYSSRLRVLMVGDTIQLRRAREQMMHVLEDVRQEFATQKSVSDLETSVRKVDCELRSLISSEIAKVSGGAALDKVEEQLRDLVASEITQVRGEAAQAKATFSQEVSDLKVELGKLSCLAGDYIERRLETSMAEQNLQALEKAIKFADELNLVSPPTVLERARTDLDDLRANCLEALTLLTSSYRNFYSEGSPVRQEIEQAAAPMNIERMSAKIRAALIAQCQAGNKPWSEADIIAFVNGLKAEIQQFVLRQGMPEPDIVQWAILAWTSAHPRLGDREFCFHFNDIIRTDNAEALRHLMPYILTLNKHLVTRLKADRNALWPMDEQGRPVRRSWRGCGLPEARWRFFRPGRKLRIPGGFATSLKMATARDFARRSPLPKVLIEVRFNRHCPDPTACMHVAYIANTMVTGESEFLFSPYSKFEVLEASPRSDAELGNYLWILLEAAVDNIGEEQLPCVEWL